MNNSNESHISYEILEALAAGDAAESRDQNHLKNCAECREALNAMRAENQLFAAELTTVAATEGAPMTASMAMTGLPVAQRHKPFVIYAAAASVMLIAALGIIAWRQAPSAFNQPPGNATIASVGQKPNHDTIKEDEKQPPVIDPVAPRVPPVPDAVTTEQQANVRSNVNTKEMVENSAVSPKPITPTVELPRTPTALTTKVEPTNPFNAKGDPAPQPPVVNPAPSQPAQEFAYDGKTTLEWLAILHQELNNKELHDMAVHALAQIGRDGLPQILSFLSQNGSNDRVGLVLSQIEVQREDLPQFSKLLKDPNFAVRKAGVQLLANLAEHQQTLANDALDAMNVALQDHDKAVVEVARNAINRLYPDATARKIVALAQAGKVDSARKALAEAHDMISAEYYGSLTSQIDYAEFQSIEKDVTEKTKKGEFEAAMIAVAEALKLNPKNYKLQALYDATKRLAELKMPRLDPQTRLKNAQEKLAAMQNANMGEFMISAQKAVISQLQNQLNELAPATNPHRANAGVGESNIGD